MRTHAPHHSPLQLPLGGQTLLHLLPVQKLQICQKPKAVQRLRLSTGPGFSPHFYQPPSPVTLLRRADLYMPQRGNGFRMTLLSPILNGGSCHPNSRPDSLNQSFPNQIGFCPPQPTPCPISRLISLPFCRHILKALWPGASSLPCSVLHVLLLVLSGQAGVAVLTGQEFLSGCLLCWGCRCSPTGPS